MIVDTSQACIQKVTYQWEEAMSAAFGGRRMVSKALMGQWTIHKEFVLKDFPLDRHLLTLQVRWPPAGPLLAPRWDPAGS